MCGGDARSAGREELQHSERNAYSARLAFCKQSSAEADFSPGLREIPSERHTIKRRVRDVGPMSKNSIRNTTPCECKCANAEQRSDGAISAANPSQLAVL